MPLIIKKLLVTAAVFGTIFVCSALTLETIDPITQECKLVCWVECDRQLEIGMQ